MTAQLLVWQSPARPFKKRDKEFFQTVFVMVFLLSLILLFLKEWLLIGVILALTFVFYVLSTVPPEQTEHKIKSEGITSGSHFYPWNDLEGFYFSKRYGDPVLNIIFKNKFPGRLLILLGELTQAKLKDVLSKYLSFKETPAKNFLDLAAEWLAKKVPLEKK